jgi:hypothetical protein
MKKQIAACFQISAYSEKTREQIAERIRNTIKDLDKPSDPIVEDWTGVDQEWPPEPEVYIFFDMEEEDEVDDKGIPLKILNAIAGENVFLWMGDAPSSEGTVLLEAKHPENVEQHIQWVGVSIDMYQHTYIAWKAHPCAEKYKCSTSGCQKFGEWYSLPKSFVELTRPECPSCNKLGTKIS